MKNNPEKFFIDAFKHRADNHLFHCGAGNGSFTVGYDGTFRLCSSLVAPSTTVNLRKMSLQEAWEDFVPQVREMQTDDLELLNTCGTCPIVNLCNNCPANAYLETGSMDGVVPFFCKVAHARARAIHEIK